MLILLLTVYSSATGPQCTDVTDFLEKPSHLFCLDESLRQMESFDYNRTKDLLEETRQICSLFNSNADWTQIKSVLEQNDSKFSDMPPSIQDLRRKLHRRIDQNPSHQEMQSFFQHLSCFTTILSFKNTLRKLTTPPESTIDKDTTPTSPPPIRERSVSLHTTTTPYTSSAQKESPTPSPKRVSFLRPPTSSTVSIHYFQYEPPIEPKRTVSPTGDTVVSIFPITNHVITRSIPITVSPLEYTRQ